MQQFKHNVQNGVSRETSPNRGESQQDLKAVSSDRESIEAWRAREGIDISQQVRIVKISHMRYQHPDLAVITKFLKGMS